MKAYIISILGITVCGVLIEIILPSGKINKYIRSIYSIFVVAVILNPVITFFANNKGLDIKYNDIELSSTLMNYINQQKVNSLQSSITSQLEQQGMQNIDIVFNYEQENYQIVYKSCVVNLKNLVYTDADKHISIYELITQLVEQQTNLTYEEIIFNE